MALLKPISIVSVKLPESQKVYMRRHNEELERRMKEVKLPQAFQQTEDVTQSKLDREESKKLVKALLLLLT